MGEYIETKKYEQYEYMLFLSKCYEFGSLDVIWRNIKDNADLLNLVIKTLSVGNEKLVKGLSPYKAILSLSKDDKLGIANIIWRNIKDNYDLLNWAIEMVPLGIGNKKTVNGLSICESILINYGEDSEKFQDIYKELIKLIFSHHSIARARNYIGEEYYDVCSFMVLALRNLNLELDEDQVSFIMKEYNRLREKNYETRIHGKSPYDIRFWALNNQKLSEEQQIELIDCFREDEESFEEAMQQWELDGHASLCKMIRERIEEIEEQGEEKQNQERVQKKSFGVWKQYNV